MLGGDNRKVGGWKCEWFWCTTGCEWMCCQYVDCRAETDGGDCRSSSWFAEKLVMRHMDENRKYWKKALKI